MGEEIVTFKTKYEKKDILGQGSYGHVYKGKLLATDQTAAIKVVAKKGAYLREIEILETLQKLDHKNLVRLLDFENLDKHLLIITEFCPLSHLSNYIEYQKPLTEGVLQIFLRQLAEGYSVLKENNVIHRDLKPHNILLCHSEYNQELPGEYPLPTHILLKIADFGISRFLDKDGKASTDIGTKMYMAPEICKNKYDYKVDLWSFGIIIIECLIGREELKKFENKKKDYAAFFKSIKKHAKKDLRNLLEQLLKRNPRKRIDFECFIAHKFLNPFGSARLVAPGALEEDNRIQAFQTPILPDSQQLNFKTQEMLTLSDENAPQPHNKNLNALAAISEVQISTQNNADSQPIAQPSTSSIVAPYSLVHGDRIQAFQTQILSESQQQNFRTEEMTTLSDNENSNLE